MLNTDRIGSFTHFWYSQSQLQMIHRQVLQDKFCIIAGRKREFTESLTTSSPGEPIPHGLWHDYTYLGYGALHSVVPHKEVKADVA